MFIKNLPFMHALTAKKKIASLIEISTHFVFTETKNLPLQLLNLFTQRNSELHAVRKRPRNKRSGLNEKNTTCTIINGLRIIFFQVEAQFINICRKSNKGKNS